jgi:hypothetical protein
MRVAKNGLQRSHARGRRQLAYPGPWQREGRGIGAEVEGLTADAVEHAAFCGARPSHQNSSSHSRRSTWTRERLVFFHLTVS